MSLVTSHFHYFVFILSPRKGIGLKSDSPPVRGLEYVDVYIAALKVVINCFIFKFEKEPGLGRCTPSLCMVRALVEADCKCLENELLDER